MLKIEENQQQEYDNVSFAGMHQPARVSDETIKWQLDPTDVLDEIVHYLKQEHKDSTDGVWKPVFKDVKPLMTDEGINSLLGILRSYLNKNTVLSNLDEDQIIFIMKDVNRTLRCFLTLNHKTFKVTKSNFTQIYHCVENHIYCFLLRAKGNGERLRWMKTQQIMETHQTVEEKGKKRLGLF